MTARELIEQRLYITQDGEPQDVHDSVEKVIEVMQEYARMSRTYYLINVAIIPDEDDIMPVGSEQFIEEAKRQELVLTEQEFQKAFNDELLSTDTMLLFIKENKQ